MKNITDLGTLMSSAVLIKKHMMVFNPVFRCPAEMNLQLDMFADRTYNVTDGILAFKDNNNVYVIPCMQHLVTILEANEFIKSDLYVPFADGGAPLEGNNRWQMMLLQSKCEQHI